MKAPSDTFSTHCDSWHFLEFSSKMSINQPCLFKIENVQDFRNFHKKSDLSIYFRGMRLKLSCSF